MSAVDLAFSEYAIALLIVLVGAFVRGYTGFGASLIWVSGLTLLMAPDEAVPIVLMMEVAASAMLLPAVWREVEWRKIRWLLVGAVFGLPVGVAVLKGVADTPMTIVVAVVAITSAFVLWRTRSAPFEPRPATVGATGLVSGILNGATSAGGVPVVLLYLGSTAGMATSRASFIAFFGGMDFIGSVMLAVQGVLDGTALWRMLSFLPAMLGGAWLGSRQFKAADPERVRRMAVVLLFALGAAGLIRAVAG